MLVWNHGQPLKNFATTKKKSTIRRNELADPTVQELENMGNEHDFSLLYKKIKVLASEIVAISPPALPRKQSEPNYRISRGNSDSALSGKSV